MGIEIIRKMKAGERKAIKGTYLIEIEIGIIIISFVVLYKFRKVE